MSQFDPGKIEEYQLILMKNPRSPVFAALAETYRKMGLLEEALEVTTRGVKHNPEFVSGLVAHGKILFQFKNYREALEALKKAQAINPENLLALRLLGHCYIKLRQHGLALMTFKKLLIVNPRDESAQQYVNRWQFLEHQGLPEDFQLDKEFLDNWVTSLGEPEKALQLIDSFLNFDDKATARHLIKAVDILWPELPELASRRQLAQQSEEVEEVVQESPLESSEQAEIRFRKEFYENCLQRIEQFKGVDHV